jgi:purine-cytosine permease-like protein
MEGTEGAPTQVWGVTTAIRRAALGVSLVFIALALVMTAVGIKPVGALLTWLVCLLVILFVWRCYLVPYVELGPDQLVVQGAFASRSVPLDTIRVVRPGVYGLRIETRTEGTIVAWAVQKSKFAEWFHRRTRADRVIEQIVARAHGAAALTGGTR